MAQQTLSAAFGVGLMAAGVWLLRRRRTEHSSATIPMDVMTDVAGEFSVLHGRAVIACAQAEPLVERLRIKLGMARETFDFAVRPVIEGYGEFVQLLPAAAFPVRPNTPTVLLQTMHTVLTALDYRRGQILPRGAPPEVIGAQLHRWTYAVFIAALLYDIDGALAELAVTMRCRGGKEERWAPVSGSLRACGASSYRVERTERVATTTDAPRRLSLLLLDCLIPPAVLRWLTAEPEPMRELRGFLAGDMTIGSGAIAALVLRARSELRCIAPSDGLKAASRPVTDSSTLVVPSQRESVDQGDAGESFAREAQGRLVRHPAPKPENSLDPSGSSTVGGDSAPMPSRPIPKSVPLISSPLVRPEFLEDFGEERPSLRSQQHRGGVARETALSGSTGESSVRLPLELGQSGHIPEADRFIHWLQAGLADGSLAFNEQDAVVHFVAEGMLLVSPRIFRDYAMRCGEEVRMSFASSGMENEEIGKAIQRQILRAGWHVRGRKGSSTLTYQVMLGDEPVARLSGVVIRSPARFITPVPPVNPWLIRLRSDHTET